MERGTEICYLAVNGSYHGDTLGAMSVSMSSGFHHPFRSIVCKAETVRPYLRHGNPQTMFDAAAQQELNQFFANNHRRFIAFIVEPLVQGAGGMLMHDHNWLQHICKLCRQYQIQYLRRNICWVW